MEINLIKDIIKESLKRHHGNKYDEAIDSLEYRRSDFRGNMCFRHEMFYIISFKNNDYDINTNLIQSIYLKSIGYKDHEWVNKIIEDFKYDNYPYVLGEIRNKKLKKIL